MRIFGNLVTNLRAVTAVVLITLFLLHPQTLTFLQPRVELLETARDAEPAPAALSHREAVKRAAPAVVNIYTTKIVTRTHPLAADPFWRHFFGHRFGTRRHQETSLGSGSPMPTASWWPCGTEERHRRGWWARTRRPTWRY
jgi:S1-C subfamily serine protease